MNWRSFRDRSKKVRWLLYITKMFEKASQCLSTKEWKSVVTLVNNGLDLHVRFLSVFVRTSTQVTKPYRERLDSRNLLSEAKSVSVMKYSQYFLSFIFVIIFWYKQKSTWFVSWNFKRNRILFVGIHNCISKLKNRENAFFSKHYFWANIRVNWSR